MGMVISKDNGHGMGMIGLGF